MKLNSWLNGSSLTYSIYFGLNLFLLNCNKKPFQATLGTSASSNPGYQSFFEHDVIRLGSGFTNIANAFCFL